SGGPASKVSGAVSRWKRIRRPRNEPHSDRDKCNRDDAEERGGTDSETGSTSTRVRLGFRAGLVRTADLPLGVGDIDIGNLRSGNDRGERRRFVGAGEQTPKVQPA